MPFYASSPYLLPIGLLICSNLFMTVAWYGHLRFKEAPIWGVILVAWGIAFIEYCFAVPANRYGNAVYSAAQLKTIQEVITLLVFAGFSLLYLKEPIGWNHLVGFALISAGAFFIFQKWCGSAKRTFLISSRPTEHPAFAAGSTGTATSTATGN